MIRAPAAGSAAASPAQPADNAANTNNDNAAPTGGGNAAMGNAQSRNEIARLWAADFRNGDDLTAPDRGYVAQVVAARTGISQADAEKRVNEVATEAKSAIDKARHDSDVRKQLVIARRGDQRDRIGLGLPAPEPFGTPTISPT